MGKREPHFQPISQVRRQFFAAAGGLVLGRHTHFPARRPAAAREALSRLPRRRTADHGRTGLANSRRRDGRQRQWSGSGSWKSGWQPPLDDGPGREDADGRGPLPDEEKQLLREWIEKGQFPSPQQALTEKRSAKINDKARQWWSFRKPVKPPVPTVRNAAKVRTPIDAFIEQKLEEKKWTLGPEADKRTLVRRAYFDLLGLPPTPEQVSEFLADTKPDAYPAAHRPLARFSSLRGVLGKALARCRRLLRFDRQLDG